MNRPVLAFIFCCTAIIANSQPNHTRWIIVTTIQYPTQALKKLAYLPGWQLLVIGDKKTPKDWYLNDSCIYLSPEDQENLPYELCKVLPWNHYSRKNIGYLYAIDHGAEIIYETDDDNYVTDGIQIFANNTNIVTLESSQPVINVYHYFGQAMLWPRGYPLPFVNASQDYTVSGEKTLNAPIVIEQGLVNNEPDLDALYRLTHQDHTDIYFDKNKPVCRLAKGVLCPFNTQNTVFHKEAFWGLYIPTHVPFRICDIWRGYITQRLLWETPYALCFTPPTAIQERNNHDYMKDFIGEWELYAHAHELIDCLVKWQPKNSRVMHDTMLDLYTLLMQHGFIGIQEEPLIHAWINDLNKILSKKKPRLLTSELF